MSKRRILNITSRKKRDAMLQFSNSTSTGTIKTMAPGPTAIRGAGNFVWCATARDLDDAAGVPNTTSQEASRTATTCFMRGVKEKITIQSSSAIPWRWRRICFSIKDVVFLGSSSGAIEAYNGWLETSNGVARPWSNNMINNQTALQVLQQEILFLGVSGVDWSDWMNAKVDTRKVDLHSDVTRNIQSGNQSGVMRTYNLWYPMNKNVVYNDDQRGGKEDTSPFSVTDKRGMGNYIIYDIFEAHATQTTADLLQVKSETCLYWHEK